MRATLNLDDTRMNPVKRAAAETGRTMTQVIEDARPGHGTKPDPGPARSLAATISM